MEALQTVFDYIKGIIEIIKGFLADLGISFEKKEEAGEDSAAK